ncbi:MAG: protein kinase domain-containing protein, partial [Mycobacterium sp.]
MIATIMTVAGQAAADGTPFGRYRLIELLGRGGMGEVWRAYDTAANNRTVAIKLLPPHLAGDSMYVQRFRREANAAAQLNNPHIIPIHNYGEIDGRLYVDMRLVEGRDLQAVLTDGPLELGRAVRIIEQVAKALQAAHKVGLVHRDVTPRNILLDEDDFAYLIDFGIARGADETSLTGTGQMIGSFHYMAPERLRAHEADARADIYALACVLYECLTGSRPFPGDSWESQVAAHLTDPPPQPSTTQPKVPAQFDAVIAKGMAKDPDNRYATTVELADAARDAITVPIQQSTPRSAPAPPTEPGQPPTMLDDRTPPSEPPDPALATTQRGPVGYPALGVHGRLPTPPRPQASASPETGGASAKLPAGPSRRAVIAISALTALVIAGVAIAAVVIARKSSSGGVATPSTSTATSSTAAQPIAESELDGLLLSPDQIYAATGASPGTTASVPGTMPNN